MTPHVAVISRPRSPTLAQCLAALREGGAREPVVHEIGADGPAVARNAALAACEGEVIAFVEDDVVVDGGWWRALEDFWASAPRGVAVAGGPLRGPEGTANVTGPSSTYPGGNVSFRTAALRGAGAFWPARGNAAQRDWLSVEHETQRELARIGWRVEFVDGLAARRLGAGPTLRERARTGARGQAIGTPRPRALAVRTLATALAGALAGRRRSRLGRAAENAGALLGPRLIHAELEPVARETPYIASVPMPPRHARRRAAHRAPTILAYHRIADVEHDPLHLAVSPVHWREQLEVLRTLGVAPLEQASAGDIAVTFDDGYADNLVLRDAGIPITLFVTTDHVAHGRPFWWDAVTRLCAERRGELVTAGGRAWILGDAARGHLQAWLQPQPPEEIARHLAELAAPPGDRPLTVEELRELADHVSVGAHTRTHPVLRRAAPSVQRAEIEGSRDDVERWLGRRPTAFAYPYGIADDAVDRTTVDLVRAAGFACAVLNEPDTSGERLTLGRHAVPDVGGDAFARWLAERRG